MAINKGREMVIDRREIKSALREVLDEQSQAGIQPIIIPPLKEEPIRIGDEVRDEPCISTSEAIDHFFEKKEDSRLKLSTKQTNLKRLKPFTATFEFLPLNGSAIRKQFLSRYNGLSPRYQRNVYDVLVDFYHTIMPKYRLPCNPMDEIGRPQVNGSSVSVPHPLNSKWLPDLICAAETDTELAALHTELGAGWRPCEFMRIKTIDVREALYREDLIILVHGKEREELTPLLPETLEVLSRLTPSNLGDHELIIRSRRVRAGVHQPMGMKAHTTLIHGLYQKAGVPPSFVPYDLRDTFGSLVLKHSKDWFLTERLMRHILPGEGKKYFRYPLEQVCEELVRFSPLRQGKQAPYVQTTATQGGVVSSGEGGTRTPTPCGT